MTQIKLIFVAFGDLLNPNIFTKIARLSPTSIGYKADPIPDRKLGLVRKETRWEYSFDFIETLLFDDIANLFIEHFSPNINEISKYINENNLETKLYLIVEIVDEETPALYFDRNFMHLITKMNGEIDIDLYNINQ